MGGDDVNPLVGNNTELFAVLRDAALRMDRGGVRDMFEKEEKYVKELREEKAKKLLKFEGSASPRQLLSKRLSAKMEA